MEQNENLLKQLLQSAGTQALKQLFGSVAKLVRKLVTKALLSILAPLAPFVAWVVLALFVFLCVYITMFVVPREAEGQPVIFYTGVETGDWTLEDDRRLVEKYKMLADKFSEGLESKEELADRLIGFSSEVNSGEIPSQVDQAAPYRLPWSVLAAVDRILREGVITGDEKPNPQPEQHYAKLTPVFTWKEYTVTKSVTYTDSKGNSYTKTYTGTVKLLNTAENFQGKFIFHWKLVSKVSKNMSVTLPVMEGLEKVPPYFAQLRNLLAENELTDAIDVENTMELAMTYDKDFEIDYEELGNAEAFDVDLTKVEFTGELGIAVWPTPGYTRITSPFGMRIHPILHSARMHTGVDIAAPMGTDVHSAQNGKVIFTGRRTIDGNVVIIDHGSYKTAYCHLSRILCDRGDRVTAGDVIGKVGNTGAWTTGPHLHFTVIKGKVHVDPLAVLNLKG